MNLLETYCHACGVQPKKAVIDLEYFPVQFERYVVIHASSGMMTKTYDYFDAVIQGLKLPVVQVGGKDDPILQGVVDLRGKCSWNQTAFIISKAALFIGGDSICQHMAACFEIPSIVLWGGTLPQTCSTNWNTHVVHLTPTDRYGCHSACHLAQCVRQKKCINSIAPEKVLSIAAQILGAEKVKNFETMFNGELSDQRIVEWIPLDLSAGTIRAMQGINGIATLRLDKVDGIPPELSAFCNSIQTVKYVVVTPPSMASEVKINQQKIEQFLIMVDESNIKEGIEALYAANNRILRPRLLSKLEHTVFDKWKLDFIEFPPMAKLNEFTPNESVVSLVGHSFDVSSKRRVLGADGAFYLTVHDALKKQNSVEITTQKANIVIENGHLNEFNYLSITRPTA